MVGTSSKRIIPRPLYYRFCYCCGCHWFWFPISFLFVDFGHSETTYFFYLNFSVITFFMVFSAITFYCFYLMGLSFLTRTGLFNHPTIDDHFWMLLFQSSFFISFFKENKIFFSKRKIKARRNKEIQIVILNKYTKRRTNLTINYKIQTKGWRKLVWRETLS